MQDERDITTMYEELNTTKVETDNIRKMIYTVRGRQVMLDSDVAMLYRYETKNLNKAMKRNIERFPEDFCFQITIEELKNMWFQNGTTYSEQKVKYRSEKYLPYVYTEQGIAMLSGLLKNQIAIDVSINIMRAFIEMRKYLSLNRHVYERFTNVEYKLSEHDKEIDRILNQMVKNDNKKQSLFFEGQIWDSYELIIDIIKIAQYKIIIIDNYIDDTILKMLQKKNKNVEVVILTSPNSSITKLDIKKFNEQYPFLKLGITNKFHDRFIIIDDRELYHCGASLKDLGKKCFAISKIEDNTILMKINEVVRILNTNIYLI